MRQEVAKPHKTQVFRGLRIESSETSQPKRDRRSHLPNFWSCRPSRHLELPVAGSHWPSGTTDLDGQLTENSEEPGFLFPPGLILGVDSNCLSGRQKREGCVKKLRKHIKPKISGVLGIESSDTSQRRRDRCPHLPNFWSCRPSRQ